MNISCFVPSGEYAASLNVQQQRLPTEESKQVQRQLVLLAKLCEDTRNNVKGVIPANGADLDSENDGAGDCAAKKDGAGDVAAKKDGAGDVAAKKDGAGDAAAKRGAGDGAAKKDGAGDVAAKKDGADDVAAKKDGAGDVAAKDGACDVAATDGAGDVAAKDGAGDVAAKKDGAGDVAAKQPAAEENDAQPKEDDDQLLTVFFATVSFKSPEGEESEGFDTKWPSVLVPPYDCLTYKFTKGLTEEQKTHMTQGYQSFVQAARTLLDCFVQDVACVRANSRRRGPLLFCFG